MRKIREALRLHYDAGLGVRAVSRSLKASPSTVREYLVRAKLQGLTWPLPESLDDAGLLQRLYPTPASSSRALPVPDWSKVHRELRRKGVTLALLWEEYKTVHPEGGIPDHGMPALHGQLRGHDRGAQSMAVLDDLEQVAAVLGAELRHPPVVDDQDGGLGDRGEQLGIAPVGARDGQLGEQAWEAPVRDGVSVAARAVSEGAGYPTLSHAGQASDILMRITAN